MGEWLNTILPDFPPYLCYLLVAVVIGAESMGIPLPGEITLIAAILLALNNPHLHIYSISISGGMGAIIGDSLGYFIGARWGKMLLNKMSHKFPHHFGEERIERVEALFHKYGIWAIFFGRFAALLRVLSGPISGMLHIRYWKFLLANVLGAITWVGLVTILVTVLGRAAEKLIARSSWTALGIIVILALAIWWKIRAAKRKSPILPIESSED